MGEIHSWSKKELTLFWTAALVGIIGGVIGNLFASVVWQLVIPLNEGSLRWGYFIIVAMIVASFIYILLMIRTQIEENRPEVESRNDQ